MAKLCSNEMRAELVVMFAGVWSKTLNKMVEEQRAGNEDMARTWRAVEVPTRERRTRQQRMTRLSVVDGQPTSVMRPTRMQQVNKRKANQDKLT